MSPLQSLETTLRQLDLADVYPATTSIADMKLRWHLDMENLKALISSLGQELPPLTLFSQHPAQATASRANDAKPENTFVADQQRRWQLAAQKIEGASSAIPQGNPYLNPPANSSAAATASPKGIPKTNDGWVVNIPCSTAFYPSSPRSSWPWPKWVCAAFEAGDVLWYTPGSDARPFLNVRERRQDLITFFERVGTNKKIAEFDGETQGLEKQILERPRPKEQRLAFDSKDARVGNGEVDQWEVVEEEDGEEGWIDVPSELKKGQGWYKVQRPGRSGGDCKGGGAYEREEMSCWNCLESDTYE